MADFRIRCDWEDDPGVADPVLARTWAQLGLWVGDEPITRFYSLRSASVKNAVYGSVFPLVTWIVDNWWFLLHESARRATVLRGGREAMRQDPSSRFWLRRHSLLTAREGYALPDLSIFRDETHIRLAWVPDPDDEFPRRGRFIDTGWCRVPVATFSEVLREFVEVVLERLDRIESEDVNRLRAAWVVILAQDGAGDEPSLCGDLAALGIHPYSPEADDDALRAALSAMPRFPSIVRQDLLDATSSERIQTDINTVAQLWTLARAGDGEAGPWRGVTDIPQTGEQRAHEVGYLRARQVRRHLRLGAVRPVDDLATQIRQQFGPFTTRTTAAAPGSDRRIDALVTHDSQKESRWIVGEPRSHTAARFRLGRALHQWLFSPQTARLLTRAQSGWEQRASRAFAAELLAPASGIRAELEQADDGAIAKVARTFDVDDAVIVLQMENHGIDVSA